MIKLDTGQANAAVDQAKADSVESKRYSHGDLDTMSDWLDHSTFNAKGTIRLQVLSEAVTV